PAAPQNNIKNVVLLSLENRSFDSIMGFWARTRSGVDGVPNTASNYCVHSNSTIAVEPNLPLYAINGAEHDFQGVAREIYGKNVDAYDTVAQGLVPTMGGFCDTQNTADNKANHLVVDGFAPENVPVFAALASEFAIADAWHSSVPGPTIPNRLFLYSASSDGHIDGPTDSLIKGYPQRSIFKVMDDAKLSWKNYFEGIPSSILLKDIRNLDLLTKIRPMTEFYSDASSGHLPHFTLIDPRYDNFKIEQDVVGVQDDGHAPGDFARAEDLVKKVYEAVRASPQWPNTLLIVTFGEIR
ncbi:hypothetical protein HK101_006164, partial [Irineochytrium annulatum]